MAEETSSKWVRRNAQWSLRWGNLFDPKSVVIRRETKEQREERIISNLSLPIGFGAHAVMREQLTSEIAFFSKLGSALANGKEQELIDEMEATDASNRQAAEDRLNGKGGPSAAELLAEIQREKKNEAAFLATCEDQEVTDVEYCKRCNHPRFVEGQVGMHRCGEVL